MSLGTTISRLRAGKGLSQEELANALGVSRQSVSKWETDSSVPELDKLVRLSDMFGVSLDQLVRQAGRKQARGRKCRRLLRQQLRAGPIRRPGSCCCAWALCCFCCFPCWGQASSAG